MSNPGLIVVALGGNAISREDEEGNVEQQFANSRATSKQLADLVDAGHRLAITHGNGPQIGNFLLRNELGAEQVYPLSMEVAVAHVQGGMGFMIAQTMTNELVKRGHDMLATAIITTVLVDDTDPAFSDPTKPIGKVMTAEEAEKKKAEDWSVKEVAPGKFRRVVASPMPKKIMEIGLIRHAVEGGDLVVTCGGGGIPVIQKPDVGLVGTAAVIDKDLASALLASQLGAETMLILTAVDQVCINFGKPNEQGIDRMTLAEAEKYMEEGQFPAGSMGPKVSSAIKFLKESKNPNAKVVIGSLDRAADALAGRTGTILVK